MPETRNRKAAASSNFFSYSSSVIMKVLESKLINQKFSSFYLFLSWHRHSSDYEFMRRKAAKSVNKFPLQVSQRPEFKSFSVRISSFHNLLPLFTAREGKASFRHLQPLKAR